MGANVYGYSLDPPTSPNLYKILGSDEYVVSKIADVADFDSLSTFYQEIEPDIVFHMAAQPLVREGYRNPRGTYTTNVVGTVNLLECIRLHGASSFVNITTDKVYSNDESGRPFKESDYLDGFDPYSNSKSCSELVTATYARSFSDTLCPTSTARAGNVIGGGDFANERILPDCVRSAISGCDLLLRNPNSTRPYQHVIEPLYSYLVLACKQYSDHSICGSYNVGPDRSDCVTTGELATMFCNYWGGNLSWKSNGGDGPHEANFLQLDNSKLKSVLGIAPLWHIDDAVSKVVEWTKAWHFDDDAIGCTDRQIASYLNGRGIVL